MKHVQNLICKNQSSQKVLAEFTANPFLLEKDR